MHGHTAHKIIKVLIDSSCNQIKNSIFVNFSIFVLPLPSAFPSVYFSLRFSRFAALNALNEQTRFTFFVKPFWFGVFCIVMMTETLPRGLRVLHFCVVFFLWVLGSLFLVYGCVCARFVIFVDNHQLINLPLLSLNLHIHRQYGGTQTTGKRGAHYSV